MDLEYNNLDDDWINTFEKTDKLFQDFYLDDIYYTGIHLIYVNTSNDIEKIKEESDALRGTLKESLQNEITGALFESDKSSKFCEKVV